MKFQAEVELVGALKTYLKSLYHREHIKIFEEVSVGYGIADIVVTDLKEGCLPCITKNSLTSMEINIYYLFLKFKKLTAKEIIDITRCSRRSIMDAICNLLDQGYLLNKNESYFINRDYEMPFRSNFAIEVKLKDWKRALKQAYRYKWFAEYSFVVLDSHYNKAALKNLDLFIKYNVGLASISREGVMQRHYSPKRQEPIDIKMQMLFSEKLKSQILLK